MNVADAYPARRQSDGSYWYKPVDLWGWTGNPDLAHPDYNTAMLTSLDPTTSPSPSPTTTTEEPAVTAPAVPFQQPSDTRETEWSKYPLPPRAPRFSPQFTGNKQYRMPDPQTGMPTAYARATTVAETLDNKYNLGRWKERTKVASVLQAVDVVLAPYGGLGHLLDAAQVEAAKAATVDPDKWKLSQRHHALLTQLTQQIALGNDSAANGPIDTIDNYNGGRDSAEFGTAVHEWLEALDLRMITFWQIPEQFRPHALAYLDCLRRAGVIALPQYVERVVMYEGRWETAPGAEPVWVPAGEVVIGTLDRIYLNVTTGELYLGDLKTSKGLSFTWVTYAVQLTIYGRATRMATTDGTGWEAMPAVNPRMALLVHVPSDNPSKSAVIPYNLATGDRYLDTSIAAREHNRNAKHHVPNLATPVPSAPALRYVAAFQAIQSAQSVDQLTAIWTEYQDVWSDDLTQLGHALAPLFTTTPAA